MYIYICSFEHYTHRLYQTDAKTINENQVHVRTHTNTTIYGNMKSTMRNKYRTKMNLDVLFHTIFPKNVIKCLYKAAHITFINVSYLFSILSFCWILIHIGFQFIFMYEVCLKINGTGLTTNLFQFQTAN